MDGAGEHMHGVCREIVRILEKWDPNILHEKVLNKFCFKFRI